MGSSNDWNTALQYSAQIMNGAIAAGEGRRARRLAREQLAKQIEYNKWAVDQQQKENQKARDWQESMWNAENEYNSASNQVARLRAAGLNPNLAYGSLSSGNAISAGNSPSSMTAPSLDMSGSTAAIGATTHAMDKVGSTLENMLMFKAQLNNIEADTNKKNAEAGVSVQEERIKYIEANIAENTEITKTDQARVEFQQARQKYFLLQNQVAESLARTKALDSEAALNDAKKDLIPVQEYMLTCMAMNNLADIAKKDAEIAKIHKEIEEIGSRIGLNFSMAGYYKALDRLTSANAENQEALNKVFATDSFVNELSTWKTKMMQADNAFNDILMNNPRWRFAGTLLGGAGSAAGGIGSSITAIVKAFPK